MKSFSYADFFYRTTLYFALIVALTAMLGSLYFSEVRHYLPCDLCWYQRICMYPLVAILSVGLLRQTEDLPYFVLPLSLIGQAIATYHYLLEKTHIFPTPTACQVGVPCLTPWINWAGFITIPFLSMCAFFLITIFALIAMTSGQPEVEEYAQTPWFPVATVFVLVVACFVVIYQFDPFRNSTLTLTVPAVGDMSPVNATAVPTVQLSYVVTGTATTTSTSSTSTSSASTTPSAETLALGQKLFSADCSVCHGSNAQGLPNLGPSLIASPIIQQQTETEALAFIRKGRPANDPANKTGMTMPPSGAHPELSDQDILAIIAFLRKH